MQEYEKYGNKCMQIARVLSTQTPTQIKKHAECFFKQNLKTNSAAVKQYQESLSPNEKSTGFGHKCHSTTNISTVSLTRKKLKYYAMMLMHTGNNASFFLLRKR
jgi:hypothetical protein